MLGTAIPKPVGNTELIADALRGAICGGDLAPGAALKQDEIAASFGVSHTPVREALKALVSEGLATLHHNRGCFVSDLSSTVARELVEFRAILEPRLAGWAIEHLTANDIRQARKVMAKIDRTSDALQRLQCATEFHAILYARADRPFFLDQVGRARNNLNRYWRLAWADQAFPLNTQDEHRRILELCIDRDRAGLMALIEQHILTSGDVVLDYLHRIEVGQAARS